MIQHKMKLGTELGLSLANCDEVWNAVALISDAGNQNQLLKSHNNGSRSICGTMSHCFERKGIISSYIQVISFQAFSVGLGQVC